MGSDGRHFDGLGVALVLRALILSLLLSAFLYLATQTHYYATALVVALCGVLTVADLFAVVGRAGRAQQRFLSALSAGTLETPPRGLVTEALLGGYERVLARFRLDRRQQLEAGQYLQTLLDTVPAALMVVDSKGTLVLVNRAAHMLFQAQVARLASLPLAKDEARQLALLSPGMHRIVRLSNGRQLLASATRFSTPDAGERRLLCLQRLAGDLDAVELKAWDDMARVLAHEMMSSLTPIASLSQSLDALLRRGGPTEEVTAALESITRRSHGLMRFVERYREVADLPAPQLQPLELRTLLAGVERLVRPAFAERGILFASKVSPPDLHLAGDADLLEQALINLLRNAGDAVAGRMQPVVEVVCGIEDGQCFIDVCDNGPGLTEAAREHIFVPFFTTKPGGSGVGLSLARRIAAGHGGQLTLQPAEAWGAVFRLSLPQPAAPAA
jgi:nitrogen fixation/metabolism regulation signal transduction histidine kinase